MEYKHGKSGRDDEATLMSSDLKSKVSTLLFIFKQSFAKTLE